MTYDLDSPEFEALTIKEKVSIWRDMGSRNELKPEHMKECIKYLRGDRLNIVEKVKKEKVTKSEAEKKQGNLLLDSLKSELGV